MRKEFASKLYEQMKNNKDIWLVVGDLGYGIWDKVREDFPDRFLNTGAAEQSAVDICIGLALEGKIPIWYSIATFLLYRPFESLRIYINHESIPVKLVASGRGKEYSHDGISHWSEDAKYFLDGLPNIHQHWPDFNEWSENGESVEGLFPHIITSGKPEFISLHR